MKVLLIENSYQHASVFTAKKHTVDNLNNRHKDITFYDLVCLVGGSDVDPALYNEEPHPKTYSTPEQDALVYEVIAECIDANVPIVGICKGAQQLCVYDGGRLHQHVTGHEGAHPITVESTGEQMHTRGNHHQMMIPSSDAVVLAYAENLSGMMYEPEAVYFPNINAVGVQYHPEWMNSASRGVEYFYELIETYLITGDKS